jgi:amyloid beta precursor protein binding protein 1
MATTDKYDRQLRLWGAKGQRALGETTVILFRATAAGTETLKNLVLPGVGKILVVDDHAVASDYASNFFVTSSITQSRAQVAFELLQELNPDVQGKWKHVDSLSTLNLEDVISSAAPETRSILVIGADLEPNLFKDLSKVCADCAVPLISVHSYGLIGSVRLQTPPLPLLEPKPTTEQPDLRLVTSFPEFTAMADSISMADLDDAAHGHVPYPILLYKQAQSWKACHNGSLPTSFSEKQEFRQAMQDAARKPDMEINFSEARDNAYLAYSEKSIDVDHLKDLLKISMNSCPKLHAMITALLQFLQGNDQQGPFNGTIPDMTSSTNLYVQLQQIYHAKAVSDVAAMRLLVPAALVDDDELDIFCKNVHHLDLLQTRTIWDEYNTTPTDELLDEWGMVTMDPYDVPEQTPFLWYMGVRACHVFFETHGRYPGIQDDTWQDDVSELQRCIEKVVSMMKLDENELVQQTLLSSDCNYAKELARYANAEIHTIASVVGGVASQEAVKIITGQYVPFNNTYIYNGIASTGGVYQF